MAIIGSARIGVVGHIAGGGLAAALTIRLTVQVDGMSRRETPGKLSTKSAPNA